MCVPDSPLSFDENAGRARARPVPKKSARKSERSMPPFPIAFAFGLSVLVAGGLACNGKPTPPAVLAAAHPKSLPIAVTQDPGFIGVVVAGEAADLESKVEGRIEAVFVKPGDKLRKGTPIARLDTEASRHELAAAQAALRDASRRLERRRRLFRGRDGAVTAEEVDTVESEVAQESAKVARLKAAVADANPVAPFDGTVAERYLAPGALAGPGRPIVRLVSEGEPRVRFAIPEERAAKVKIGTPVEIKIATPPLRLAARVSGLNPEVDSSSRMVYAIATLKQMPSARLGTGLIARVFATGEPDDHEADGRAPAALPPPADMPPPPPDKREKVATPAPEKASPPPRRRASRDPLMKW
jgi:RND family efflux transporter MFP subunit